MCGGEINATGGREGSSLEGGKEEEGRENHQTGFSLPMAP